MSSPLVVSSILLVTAMTLGGATGLEWHVSSTTLGNDSTKLQPQKLVIGSNASYITLSDVVIENYFTIVINLTAISQTALDSGNGTIIVLLENCSFRTNAELWIVGNVSANISTLNVRVVQCRFSESTVYVARISSPSPVSHADGGFAVEFVNSTFNRSQQKQNSKLYNEFIYVNNPRQPYLQLHSLVVLSQLMLEHLRLIFDTCTFTNQVDNSPTIFHFVRDVVFVGPHTGFTVRNSHGVIDDVLNPARGSIYTSTAYFLCFDEGGQTSIDRGASIDIHSNHIKMNFTRVWLISAESSRVTMSAGGHISVHRNRHIEMTTIGDGLIYVFTFGKMSLAISGACSGVSLVDNDMLLHSDVSSKVDVELIHTSMSSSLNFSSQASLTIEGNIVRVKSGVGGGIQTASRVLEISGTFILFGSAQVQICNNIVNFTISTGDVVHMVFGELSVLDGSSFAIHGNRLLHHAGSQHSVFDTSRSITVDANSTLQVSSNDVTVDVGTYQLFVHNSGTIILDNSSALVISHNNLHFRTALSGIIAIRIDSVALSIGSYSTLRVSDNVFSGAVGQRQSNGLAIYIKRGVWNLGFASGVSIDGNEQEFRNPFNDTAYFRTCLVEIDGTRITSTSNLSVFRIVGNRLRAGSLVTSQSALADIDGLGSFFTGKIILERNDVKLAHSQYATPAMLLAKDFTIRQLQQRCNTLQNQSFEVQIATTDGIDSRNCSACTMGFCGVMGHDVGSDCLCACGDLRNPCWPESVFERRFCPSTSTLQMTPTDSRSLSPSKPTLPKSVTIAMKTASHWDSSKPPTRSHAESDKGTTHSRSVSVTPTTTGEWRTLTPNHEATTPTFAVRRSLDSVSIMVSTTSLTSTQATEDGDDESRTPPTSAVASVVGSREAIILAASSTAALAVASFVASPTAVSQAVRLGSVLSVLHCQFEDDDAMPSFLHLPLQIPFGSSTFGVLTGATFCTMVAFIGIPVALVVGLSLRKDARGLLMSRIAGNFAAMALGYLGPNVLNGAVIILHHADVPLLKLFAAVSLLGVVLALLAAYLLIRRFRLRRSDFSNSCLSPFVEAARNTNFLVEVYFIEDLAISCLTALVDGIKPSSMSCVGPTVLISITCTVHFAYLALLRPYRSKLEMFLMLLCSFITAA